MISLWFSFFDCQFRCIFNRFLSISNNSSMLTLQNEKNVFMIKQNVTWSRGMSWMSDILFFRYWQRKRLNSFVLYCFQYWWIAHNSVTRYPILTGFASKCSIFKLSDGGVKNSKLNIFDMWFNSLDHVRNDSQKKSVKLNVALYTTLTQI